MIQVWCYDYNNIFTESKMVEEIDDFMTTIPIGNIGFYKPKWNGTEWIESATDEEIKAWQEANKPPIKEPTQTEILQKQLLETQAIVANLQEQILLNQNGGK